jgi:hypothetical protein
MLGNNSRAVPGQSRPEKAPVVAEVWVYGADLPSQGLRLDRPAWFAWLDAPTTTRFSYPVFDRRQGYIIGFMTVRKERRQRGGTYWTAYRRQGGRLRKIYLGKTPVLTQARLDEVAATLLAELDR